MVDSKKTGLAELIGSMVIFGTIGLFRKFIPLDSALLAFLRGITGGAFLLLFVLIKNKRIFCSSGLKKNLAKIIISGGFIGLNWVLLFESYMYTSVATATLCYYMAPVFVIFASPFVLKEKLTLKKMITAAVAIFGMVLVSGVLSGGGAGMQSAKGILLGLGAAVFYSCVILLNKQITETDAFDKTVIQLLCAGAAVLPYVIAKTDFSEIEMSPVSVLLTVIVCVVHTGIAYALYFGCMDKLSTGTVAVFSYLDPVVALISSQLVSLLVLPGLLDEAPLDFAGIAGAVLIIVSAAAGEINIKKKVDRN